jgi:hypothetical protein
MASIRRAALLAVLGHVRGVLLVTTLTTVVLMGIVFALGWMAPAATVDQIGASIEALQGWQHKLAGFGPYWGAAVILLLVLALGIYAYRSGKLRMEKAFGRVLDQELERLKRKLQNGEWEPLPPTPEMLKVQEALNQQQAQLQALQESASSLEEEVLLALQEQTARQIHMLEEYWKVLDIQRRIDLKLDPDAAALPPPRTWWEKVQTFFISQGLLACLGRGRRLLYLASLVLLVPCLMGVYSPKVGTALGNRVVALEDLRFRLTQEEARKEWQQAKLGLGEPVHKLTEEDKQTLTALAHQFETKMAAAVAWPEPQAARWMPSYTLRATAVREQILNHAAAHAPTRLEKHPSMANAPNLEPKERSFLKIYEKAGKAPAVTTEAGKRVLVELQDAAGRSPSLMQRLKAQLKSFQVPAGRQGLSAELANQMIGALLGEAPEVHTLLGGLDVKKAQTVLARLQETSADRFLTELARGTKVERALNIVTVDNPLRPVVRPAEMAELKQVMKTTFNSLPEKNALAKLTDHPPSVDTLMESHINPQRLTDAVKELKTRAPLMEQSPNRLTQSLAGYRDEFPPFLKAEAKTLRGQFIETHFPQRNVPAAQVERIYQQNFSLSRSFGRLQGFSRVGGVLIGRKVSGGEGAGLSVKNIRWETSGSGVRQVLVLADGRELRSRVHPKSLVYQALAYAADGRKVAVTICTTYPLGEASVLLHPTLVDTPLGRRIIELDQFINRYASEDEEREAVLRNLYAQVALYKLAWAKLVLGLEPAAFDPLIGMIREDKRKEFREGILQQLEYARWRAGRIADDPLTKHLAAEALKDPALLTDPERSPLTTRKNYFEETLVKLLVRSTRGPRTVAAFGRSFEPSARAEFNRLMADFSQTNRRFAESVEQANERLNKNLQTILCWLRDPPEFELRGIVREKPFTATPANVLCPDGTPVPQPFDFFLQMVFTSSPIRADDAAQADEVTEERAWEIRTLTKAIQDKVFQALAKDKRAHAILTDAAEFALLQRLFGMALQHHFGEDFPVERLAALAEATAPAKRPAGTRTLRWDTRWEPREVTTASESAFGLAGALREFDPKWEPPAYKELLAQAQKRGPNTAVRRPLKEWPQEVRKQLEGLRTQAKGGEAARQLTWCLATLQTLDGYFPLLAENVEQRQQFKELLEGLVKRKLATADGPQAAEWQREWERALNRLEKWEEDWAARWARTMKEHPLPQPAVGNERGQAKDVPPKLVTCTMVLQYEVGLIKRADSAIKIRQAFGVVKDQRQVYQERVEPLPGLGR